MKIFFPGKQGISLENGICPPAISILWIAQILSAGFLNSLE